LIASFSATLEDAVNADLLIHIKDASHPDVKAQDDNVHRTLKSLKHLQPLLDGIITVGNKIDKIDRSEWMAVILDGVIPISCTEGYGLEFLLESRNG